MSVFSRRTISTTCVPFQYFLREEDIGKPRATAMLPRISELNAYVPVRNLGGKAGQEITVDLIQPFQVRRAFLVFVGILMIATSRWWCCAMHLTKNNRKSMNGRINMVSTLLLRKREGFLGESSVGWHSGIFTDELKLRVQRLWTQVYLRGPNWRTTFDRNDRIGGEGLVSFSSIT